MSQGDGAAPRKARITLFQGADFASAWENVLLPWFKSTAKEAFRDERPTLVIVPSRAYAMQLRRELLDAGLSSVAIKFCTPFALREILSRRSGTSTARREHLRLLLSIAAEQVASTSSDATTIRIARAVARGSDRLLRAVDELNAAGWSLNDVQTPAGVEIVSRFNALREGCHFALLSDADRAFRNESENTPPILSNVLVSGFNAAHWSSWHLLSGAVHAAERATVILNDPREEARALDEAWIGTWEQTFGGASPVPASAEPPDHGARVEFFAARDTQQQADAITLLAVRYLSETEKARIAIFLPRAGALARRVTESLRARGILHDDGIGHPANTGATSSEVGAWIRFQQNPRVRLFVRFLRTCRRAVEQFDGMPLARVEKAIRAAYGSVMIDDIALLRAYCEQHRDPEVAAQMEAGLDAIDLLPDRAKFSGFVNVALRGFNLFGWSNYASRLDLLSRVWCGNLEPEFSRETFLTWLGGIVIDSQSEREGDGAHPYSRVHLATYDDAGPGNWSHVILGGLNEGEWPAVGGDSGFLSPEQVRELNARALATGNQGAGHIAVTIDRSLLLTSNDKRNLARRNLRDVLDSARTSVAVTAQLFGDKTPGRAANPSEFFARLYFERLGEPISRNRFENMQRGTEAWLQRSDKLQASPSGEDVRQTSLAFHARRDALQPAGEFECTLREPPEFPATLHVMGWSKALRTPALIWFSEFLGIDAEEEELASWHKATGIWVHDWLASILPARDAKFAPLPDPLATLHAVESAALKFRQQVDDLASATIGPLPDWWTSGWRNAQFIANRLARRVASLEHWASAAVEVAVRPKEAINVASGKSLQVRGRIDLILVDHDGAMWVIDYKTGGTADLGSKRNIHTAIRGQLIDGKAMQVALYGLAMRARGAKNVGMSLLTRTSLLDRPQFTVEHVLEHEDFWAEIVRMAQTGTFGLLGDIRSEYGMRVTYPIATTPIDRDILEEKWIRTHPAFER